MSEAVKFEKSSGNVFLDIGFSEEEAEQELLRSDLAFEVHSVLKERKLTRTEVGEILGIDKSDVSLLKKGDFHCFSAEHMSSFLNRLDRNVKGCITLTGNTSKH